MPHDKNGELLIEGDYVTGRVETFPGHFWEGIGRVVELRAGPVCNVVIAEVDAQPWKDEDYEERNSYMNGVTRISTYDGKTFRADVKFIQASASDLYLVHSPCRGIRVPERLPQDVQRVYIDHGDVLILRERYRSLGEADAVSILAERAGLPGQHTLYRSEHETRLWCVGRQLAARSATKGKP